MSEILENEEVSILSEDYPVSLPDMILVDDVDDSDDNVSLNFDGFSEIIEMEENLSPANSAFNALLRKH